MRAIFIALSCYLFSFHQAAPSTDAGFADVYVCLSSTAYAYHDNRQCRGLAQCTHKIEKMPVETARNKYKRRACGYCY